MSTKYHPVLVLILLVLVSSLALADLPFFTVTGTAKQFDGQVAKNVKIRLSNQNRVDLAAVETQTDSQGKFRLFISSVKTQAAVVKANEVLELQVYQQEKLIALTEHRMTAAEIELGFAIVDVKTFSPLLAKSQEITVQEDSQQEILLVAEGGNQDQVSFQIETTPQQGQLSTLEGNKVIYTPQENYFGL